MESNYNKKTALLNHKMKIIGIIFAVVSLGLGITFKNLNSEAPNSEILGVLTYTGMILGLLMISLSRDKIEDERVASLRAQAMQVAFITAVISTVIRPIIDLMFGDPIETEQAYSVVFFMLLVYNFFFLFLKKCA